MNKKILTTAMGAILAGAMGFAQAGDVTVFGNVNVSIDSTDSDGGTDDINMNSNTSSLGVKGSEDLGNGLKAIFQAEFQFDADETNDSGNNSTTLGDRDQFVGLEGGFGKVRFGSLSDSYKSHGAMIDPIYRTSLQNRDAGLQSGLHSGSGETGGRMTNHVRYDSPDMSGFGVTVDYSFDENKLPEDNDSYGIGGQYKNGGILVFADYLTNDDGGDLDDAWKLGGSFGINEMFAVYAQYEEGGLLNYGSATSDASQWVVAGSASMGNTMLYLGYGQADELVGAAYSHDAVTLAVDHHLSKRTDVYGGWAQVDIDGTGETDLISVGMRHKF